MKAQATRWRYAAEDSSGGVVSGALLAENVEAAKTSLKAQRLDPISIRPAPRTFWTSEHEGEVSRPLPLSALASLSRKLANLLSAGLPLTRALSLGADHASAEHERRFFQSLLGKISAGRSMSEALQASGFAVPQLFSAFVAAGESLGAFAPQFARLAAHYEDALKLRREIIAQLLYPVALVVMIFATLLFLSFLVLPQFEGIFRTADAAPPPETKFVIAAGAAVRAYWYLGPLVLAGAVLALRLAQHRYPLFVERAELSLPFVGRVRALQDYGSYFRTLATLLEGGMPLAPAMPLARAAVQFETLRIEFEAAEVAVRRGKRFGAALAAHTKTPPELRAFITIGEESGELGKMAGEAARVAETKVRVLVRRVMLLAAPVLTALMGLITAGVIAAVMSGVLSLNEAVY